MASSIFDYEDNNNQTLRPREVSQTSSASTRALHSDDHWNRTPDVAPPIHLSTTFRYSSNPDDLVPAADEDHSVPTDAHVYSRATAPNTTRLETLLQSLLLAPCLTYSSGLAALHALYVFLRPDRVSVGAGYHGSRGVLGLHEKLYGMKVLPLECPAEDLQKGDVIHLETPVNPTGEVRHIAAYAKKAHSRGAILVIDATFGPPGLQEPFQWGADVVIHSGTKYIGGHSDMLMGVLATKREKWLLGMKAERVFLGSVMGSLEAWLGLRSLRTLGLRVKAQSENAGKLVYWLDRCLNGKDDSQDEGEAVRSVVERVQHASLQRDDMGWLTRQMPNGFGPVFAIWMKDEILARQLPNYPTPTYVSSALNMANYLASIFGTEQDKVNCSFYYKIGACRHGDRCSRKHVKPSYSQTILLPNLYQNPAYDPKNKMNPSQLQNHFDAFYEDFWCEMCKYGEPEEVVVCDNNNDHLIGNVYARFKYEDSAQSACDALNSRWYAARPIYCELSPVTDFREACCRLNSGEGCVRGGFCNFIHRKEPSPELERELELGTKKWLRARGRDDRSVTRSPSPEPTRKRY